MFKLGTLGALCEVEIAQSYALKGVSGVATVVEPDSTMTQGRSRYDQRS